MRDHDRHYDSVAIALHWVIGAALIAQIVFGFLLDDLAPRGTPARAQIINLHKSIGLLIGLAVLARLAWRLAHRPPPWPDSMAHWKRRAALAVHRSLYACMVVSPLAGYVASNFSKHGVRFFGMPLKPWGPDSPATYAFFNGLHDIAGYLLVTLLALHVGAALKHGLVDRDGVFSRMLPHARAAPGGLDVARG